MMQSHILTLNIGLGDPVSLPDDERPMNWSRRLRIALDWLMRHRCASVRFRPGGQHRAGEEPVLVAEFLRGPLHTGPDDRELFALCRLIQQDCVASYEAGHLRLVGPRAGLYEPADMDKFLFLADA